MYTRLIALADKEETNPWSGTGIFTVAAHLIHLEGEFDEVKYPPLTQDEKNDIRAVFRWFGSNIPCPPFTDKKKEWGDDAICWSFHNAKESIGQLERLVKPLIRLGFDVLRLKTAHPGVIVYQDQFQVVAQVLPWRFGIRRDSVKFSKDNKGVFNVRPATRKRTSLSLA